jgi:cytochrome c oxidase cbb3-type subunit 3
MTRPGLSRSCRLLALLAVATMSGCEREKRSFHTFPPAANPGSVVQDVKLVPGPPVAEVVARNPYEQNAYAVSEGKRLYGWYNCTGCHSHGGGGIGPPLMDQDWIYGSDPENVYESIAEGRPNGMPAFGPRVGSDDIWKLVAYVRSMSALNVPLDVRGGRDDHMQVRQPEQEMPPARQARPTALPKASETP